VAFCTYSAAVCLCGVGEHCTAYLWRCWGASRRHGAVLGACPRATGTDVASSGGSCTSCCAEAVLVDKKTAELCVVTPITSVGDLPPLTAVRFCQSIHGAACLSARLSAYMHCLLRGFHIDLQSGCCASRATSGQWQQARGCFQHAQVTAPPRSASAVHAAREMLLARCDRQPHSAHLNMIYVVYILHTVFQMSVHTCHPPSSDANLCG
jgi:hypothetical protein